MFRTKLTFAGVAAAAAFAPSALAQSETWCCYADVSGTQPSVVSAPAANGFDWGDAGIGAGATAGLGLAFFGSSRLLHRRRVVTA